MIAAARVVQRNALVYRHVWRGSVFSSFLQPSLFLLAMGFGVGGMMNAQNMAFPNGLSYVEFLAPGLLAAAAMQVATFESTYPVLGKMVWQRNYEAIMATPMSVADLVFGELAWIAVRLSMVALAFVLVMTAFGIARSPSVWLAVPATGLTGLAFAAPVMALAGTMKTTGNFNVLYRFGITPLFLFSGVFFPVSRLPESLQALVWFSPLFHGVELVRGLTNGAMAARWALHIAFLAVIVAAGVAGSLVTFRRRLQS
jgi:lipooligosaccharide transport system permease protein